MAAIITVVATVAATLGVEVIGKTTKKAMS
jgi:hypothetical protein